MWVKTGENLKAYRFVSSTHEVVSLAVKFQPNLFHDIIATCTARETATVSTIDVAEAIDQVAGTSCYHHPPEDHTNDLQCVLLLFNCEFNSIHEKKEGRKVSLRFPCHQIHRSFAQMMHESHHQIHISSTNRTRFILTVAISVSGALSTLFGYSRGRDGGADVCSRIRNSISIDWISL